MIDRRSALPLPSASHDPARTLVHVHVHVLYSARGGGLLGGTPLRVPPSGGVSPASGPASGVGGGGLYVPVLILAAGLSSQAAVPISTAIIFGNAFASLAFNAGQRHPTADRPLATYLNATQDGFSLPARAPEPPPTADVLTAERAPARGLRVPPVTDVGLPRIV